MNLNSMDFLNTGLIKTWADQIASLQRLVFILEHLFTY